VKENQLFRTVGLICALTVAVSLGLPTPTAAQSTTSAPRGSSAGKLTLPQRTAATTASQATPAARRPAAQTATKSTPAKTRTTAAARRRAAAQARAAAAARALREAQQPKFRLDDNGVEIPDLRAAAAIVYDPATGHVLYEQNAQNERSIASITKIMTAVVFLENAPEMTTQVVVTAADTRAASTTYLRAGYKVTADTLLHLTLIGSDNAAARVLSRISTLGSSANFMARMNERAQELGLTSTHYDEPTGLVATNVSSAYDMARLISYAGNDSRISSIMQMPRYEFKVGTRTIGVNSTNALVKEGTIDVIGGKTGFIRKAGYCLATLLRLPQGGPEVAVVVLGAQSSLTRFWEARHLFNWVTSQASELLGGTPLQAAPASN
jgi:D-alanyl-D-alanine endopeptidase (penicillin-binding protein 7)